MAGLGFDSAFFRRQLPRYGLEVDGIFDSWADVPGKPTDRSHKDLLILRVKRSR